MALKKVRKRGKTGENKNNYFISLFNIDRI